MQPTKTQTVIATVQAFHVARDTDSSPPALVLTLTDFQAHPRTGRPLQYFARVPAHLREIVTDCPIGTRITAEIRPEADAPRPALQRPAGVWAALLRVTPGWH